MTAVCPICLSDVGPDSHTLPCGHLFHTSCLLSAVLKGHCRCPLCRSTIVEATEGEEEGWDGESEAAMREYETLLREEEEEETALFDRALSLYEGGGAPPDLAAAVEAHREAVAALQAAWERHSSLLREAEKHARRCRAATDRLLRDAPPGVRSILRVGLDVNRSPGGRWEGEVRVDRTRTTVVETASKLFSCA